MHFGHVLEAGPVFAEQLLVHVHDEIVVFGVDSGDAAGLRQYLQHLPDVAEIDHSALAAWGNVGREDLDAWVPGLDRLGQLRQQLMRQLTLHHRVKRIVAMAIAGPFLLPPLDRLLHGVAVADQREIEDRRCAAMERRLADPRRPIGHLMLGGAGNNDRPAAMDMRIDPAGNDDLPRRVDEPAPAPRAPRTSGGANGYDLTAGDTEIGRLRPRRKNREPVGDDNVQHLLTPPPS